MAFLRGFIACFAIKMVSMTLASTWPAVLGKLLQKHALQRTEADWAMTQIMAGDASDAQVGAFMLALRSKGETPTELAGLVDVMLRNAVILDTGNHALDIVGTGGDMVGTVNVSSMSAILASAMGVPVMKHGSRSASGKTGSSEMLEVLGIRLDLSPERVADVFREVGITFFFAPVFHPAMRYVAPIRKQLGIPTTFNFLGPLANPAQPIATSLGVADASVAPLMASEMAARGRTALVFRGSDGLDELTTTGNSEIWQVSGGEVQHFHFDPTALGIRKARLEDLVGGDAQHNAHVAKTLFEEKPDGAIADIVKLNAAAGLVAFELAKESGLASTDLNSRFESAFQKATAALESGAAAEKLSNWMAATQA
jgi:anthranilate phosphoribosyltransferase